MVGHKQHFADQHPGQPIESQWGSAATTAGQSEWSATQSYQEATEDDLTATGSYQETTGDDLTATGSYHETTGVDVSATGSYQETTGDELTATHAQFTRGRWNFSRRQRRGTWAPSAVTAEQWSATGSYDLSN